jgi:hypothetical protein
MFEFFAQMRLDYGADDEEGGGHTIASEQCIKLMKV